MRDDLELPSAPVGALPDPHPRYGPCDAFGPGEECSQCTGLIERIDGSIIRSDGSKLVRPPPLRRRIQQAWHVLRRGELGCPK